MVGSKAPSSCSCFYWVCGAVAVALTVLQLYYNGFVSSSVANITDANDHHHDAPFVHPVASNDTYTNIVTRQQTRTPKIVTRSRDGAAIESNHKTKGLAKPNILEKAIRTELYIYSNEICHGNATDVLGDSDIGQKRLRLSTNDPASVELVGQGMVELASRAKGYVGVLLESDGCFDLKQFAAAGYVLLRMYAATNTTAVLTEKRQVSETLQRQFSTVPDLSQPHTRIVFSVSSSHYFGYQVYANAFAFLQTKPTHASWMRLLTARQPDDLSERLPTFTGPKHPWSEGYTPFNKPDVIDKWFHSKDAPHPEDIIVVIDPDNWLLLDIEPYTRDVSAKHAVGMQAYYHGARRLSQQLWRSVCRENCQRRLDLVGVPYILQASDLKDIAPLWKEYLMLLRTKWDGEEAFRKEYGRIGMEWSMEMFAFNFGAAHLGITTKVVNDLQVRDVETTFPGTEFEERPMIHMGRAWFPKEEAQLAEPWRSSDDGGQSSNGIQVWCKCNLTAGEIHPWPLPKQMDFVSKHTLRLLHESREYFGSVPVNASFRKQENYYWSAP